MNNYTNLYFNSIINCDDIKTIFEVGSRDALDAISLSNQYPTAIIYSFECNPLTVETCRNNIYLAQKTNIVFHDCALGNINTVLPFYSYIKDIYTTYAMVSSGSSSLLKRYDFNETQKYIKDVTVKTIESFCQEKNIKTIDLLCMDVQGFELNVLQGIGPDIMQHIKYVILETTKPGMTSSYENCPSYSDIDNFMMTNGFRQNILLEENSTEMNILYSRTAFPIQEALQSNQTSY